MVSKKSLKLKVLSRIHTLFSCFCSRHKGDFSLFRFRKKALTSEVFSFGMAAFLPSKSHA
jgi:hypothetical protein